MYQAARLAKEEAAVAAKVQQVQDAQALTLPLPLTLSP